MAVMLIPLRTPQKQLLTDRLVASFHDHVRGAKLLNSTAQQDVHLLIPRSALEASQIDFTQSTNPDSEPPRNDLQPSRNSPEREAVGMVLYNRHPGRPSYAIFVLDLSKHAMQSQQLQVSKQPVPACTRQAADGQSSTSKHSLEHMLLRAILDGIMALPDPGRLSFSCMPAWAVPTMVLHLGQQHSLKLLCDEPCVKLACSSRSSSWVTYPSRTLNQTSLDGYCLEMQLHASDLDSVDATWAYSSAFSRPLLNSFALHNLVCCARHVAGYDMSSGQTIQASSQNRTMQHAAESSPAQALPSQHAADDSAPSTTSTALTGCSINAAAAVAWCLQYHDGSMGVAFTLPEHRRKGLMRAVLCQLSDAILDSGQEEAFS